MYNVSLIVYSYFCFIHQSVSTKEVVDAIAGETGLKKKDIDNVLTLFSDLIKKEVLENSKSVNLKNFGVYKLKETKDRKGRNPSNGETIDIKGSKSVTLSFSKSLRLKEEQK